MLRRRPVVNRFALMEGTVPDSLLPRKREHKGRPKVTTPEHDLQVMAEKLAHRTGQKFLRIPDTLLAYLMRPETPEWIRIFVAEYLKGIPDMLLIKPIPGTPYNLLLPIELKTEAGAVRQGQKKWAQGANVSVARGWDEYAELAVPFYHKTVEQLLKGKSAAPSAPGGSMPVETTETTMRLTGRPTPPPATERKP